MCTFGLSGCRVKPPQAPPDRAAGARTRQPENSKRAHFRAPALLSPPKFHERIPRERKKKENCGGRREKKREILGSPPFGAPPFGETPFGAPTFGAPTFGAPTFRAPLFLGLGLHPRGLHPLGAPQMWSKNSTSKNWRKSNWPKSKLAEVEIGRSRNWPKSIALSTNTPNSQSTAWVRTPLPLQSCGPHHTRNASCGHAVHCP